MSSGERKVASFLKDVSERWICSCAKTLVVVQETNARIQGEGYMHGQPYDGIACRKCGDVYLIFPVPSWDHTKSSTAKGRRTAPSAKRRRRPKST